MAASRSRRRAITLSAVAVVVGVGLYQAGGVVQGLRGAGAALVRPFSWAVSTIATPVGHMLAGAVNYSSLVTQNQQLRAALGAADLRAQVNAEAAQSLAQLEASLDLPFVGTIPTVASVVVGSSPTNFSATVTIDKGRADGLLVGMPVVGNGGLVGRLSSVSAHGAVVQLITDPNASESVTFGSRATTVVASGRGVNNGLAVGSIPVTTSLTPHQIFFTSGIAGGTFPAGIPVASVTAVTVTPGSSTYSATVAPVADLNHLVFVSVLLWEPNA